MFHKRVTVKLVHYYYTTTDKTIFRPLSHFPIKLLLNAKLINRLLTWLDHLSNDLSAYNENTPLGPFFIESKENLYYSRIHEMKLLANPTPSIGINLYNCKYSLIFSSLKFGWTEAKAFQFMNKLERIQ